MAPRRPMVISKPWFQAAIVTFALGLGVLGYLAWRTQADPQPPSITDPDEIRGLTAYFAWAAWVAAALRPDTDHSYTNNWPPEPLAGKLGPMI